MDLPWRHDSNDGVGDDCLCAISGFQKKGLVTNPQVEGDANPEERLQFIILYDISLQTVHSFNKTHELLILTTTTRYSQLL